MAVEKSMSQQKKKKMEKQKKMDHQTRHSARRIDSPAAHACGGCDKDVEDVDEQEDSNCRSSRVRSFISVRVIA